MNSDLMNFGIENGCKKSRYNIKDYIFWDFGIFLVCFVFYKFFFIFVYSGGRSNKIFKFKKNIFEGTY